MSRKRPRMSSCRGHVLFVFGFFAMDGMRGRDSVLITKERERTCVVKVARGVTGGMRQEFGILRPGGGFTMQPVSISRDGHLCRGNIVCFGAGGGGWDVPRRFSARHMRAPAFDLARRISFPRQTRFFVSGLLELDGVCRGGFPRGTCMHLRSIARGWHLLRGGRIFVCFGAVGLGWDVPRRFSTRHMRALALNLAGRTASLPWTHFCLFRGCWSWMGCAEEVFGAAHTCTCVRSRGADIFSATASFLFRGCWSWMGCAEEVLSAGRAKCFVFCRIWISQNDSTGQIRMRSAGLSCFVALLMFESDPCNGFMHLMVVGSFVRFCLFHLRLWWFVGVSEARIFMETSRLS